METTRALEEKREGVLEQMRAIRCMRRGSVTEQYLRVPQKCNAPRFSPRIVPRYFPSILSS
jgi:hypothetical protein